MPYPSLLQQEPLPLQQSSTDLYLHRRHSNTQKQVWVSVESPGVHKVLFEPSEHLWWVWGLILNAILPLLPFFWVFSFACERTVFNKIFLAT